MGRLDDGYIKFLRQLNLGEAFTYEAIVQNFQCDRRTAERWIRRAQGEGIPLQTVKEGRKNLYIIPPEHRPSGTRIDLTELEILALTIAAEAAHASLGPTHLGQPLHSGIGKLLQELPGEFYHTDIDHAKEQWHFSSNPSAILDPAIFQQLMKAVEVCETLAITYVTAKRGERTYREIDPYGFAAPKGSWMVVAWCHNKRKHLNFSIADIRSITPTGKFFIRDDFDLHQHFHGQFGGVGGERMYNVVLLIEPDRVAAFRRKQYHASQQLEEVEDNRAIVRFTVAGLEDLRSFAQSWGTGITVLEPEELVDIMHKEARTLAEMYNKRTDFRESKYPQPKDSSQQ